MELPKRVKLVEVGPRDGLQNESTILSIEKRIDLIDNLSKCGFSNIEVGSFVSSVKIPQLDNTDLVLNKINRAKNVKYSALVPNEKGLEKAIKANLGEIAIFAAASEKFSIKNINCSIEESLDRYKKVISRALENNMTVRGYVSCIFDCPYEGEIAPSKVQYVAEQLYKFGCYEIALGDTIGSGTPDKTKSLITAIAKVIPIESLALHFHDTYGLSMVNIYTALAEGVSTFDCAISGLGGCPYAKGSSGNVVSEDLVYFLKKLNIETYIDLEKLISVSKNIIKNFDHPSNSKVLSSLG